MEASGHTTVIRRFLERRGRPDAANSQDATGTIAVMLRLLPPPRLLLALAEPALRAAFSRRLASELVAVEIADSDELAMRCLQGESCHILVTDNLELVRRVRAQQNARNPVVIAVIDAIDGIDAENERVSAIRAGADDCIARRAHDEELHGRIGLARRIAELEVMLRTTLAENRKLAAIDELTGLSSRRFFAQHFPREVERAARYARPLALVLCDIDHFKVINDTRGHGAGDEVLRQFGARLRQSLRPNADWVARLGGEEFAVVLPETGPAPALQVARKLRAAVSDAPFVVESVNIRVTASFGVCALETVPLSQPKIPDRLLKAADAALYRSKNAGRNRVTAAAIT